MKLSVPSVAIFQVATNQLTPHPDNCQIYGNEDVSELAELICQSGWLKPLVCTQAGTIISGHRRWKAALELGLESIPVEYRSFLDETAELEALLLENASRVKTTEQKVREASAWESVEKAKAKQRQQQAAAMTNQKLGRDSSKTLMENFPQASKGTTRDAIASRVGLGSGRTYSKAAKVVERIDVLVEEGKYEQATALRQVLNEKSVDAATKLVKRISVSAIALGASLDRSSLSTGNFGEDADSSEPQRSCWNCQHRGELIENHSFYCYRLGALCLIDNSADTRGASCELWSYLGSRGYDEAKNKPQPTQSTFTLTLPAHLQPLIQHAARTVGMSVVDWATTVLESGVLGTCNDNSAMQPTDKPEMQVAQCRSP